MQADPGEPKLPGQHQSFPDDGSHLPFTGLDVAGWIFNDQYLNYEQEIVSWSGYPALFSLPLLIRCNHSAGADHCSLSMPGRALI